MDSVATEKKGYGIYLYVAVLSVYIIQCINGGVMPAIAGFASKFSDIALTDVMLIATIPSLVGIPVGFVVGRLVKALGNKLILILSIGLFLISTVVPLLFQDSFSLLLVCRALSGVSFGILFPMGPILVVSYFPIEKRPALLAWGNNIVQGVGLVLGPVGGILAATKNVYNVWYVNFLLLVPFVLAFFLPATKTADPVEQVEEKAAPTVKAKVPGKTYVFIILYFLMILMVNVIYLYQSSILEQSGIGNTATAGFLQSVRNVGGILVGIAFARMFKMLGGRLLFLSSVLMGIELAVVAFTDSLILYYIVAFLGGVGFSGFTISVMTGINLNTPIEAIGTANGISMSLLNLAVFGTAYFASFVSNIFGQADNLRFPLVVSAVFFFAYGIIAFIKPPKIAPEK